MATDHHHDPDRAAETVPGSGRPTPPPEPARPTAAGARRQVEGYRIERRLGAGGMGEVYLAWQDHPRRRVALKVIRRDRVTRGTLRRFDVEARLLGRLQHPGIARIYEAGACDLGDGAVPFVAMEFVDGCSLADWAGTDSDPRRVLEMVARIAEAVDHAHRKGVIHRDLKPANILVDGDGHPRVLDFGVSRATEGSDDESLTMHGELVGTLPYMSPEQLAGDPDQIDTRSDVYALGVIAFELLTGTVPHELAHCTLGEAVRRVTEHAAPTVTRSRPRLRGDVETIVATALEKDADRRYQSAAEFAADIRRWLADEPIRARPQTTGDHLRRFARRHRGLVVVATLGAVGMVVAATALAHAGLEAARARDRARTEVATTRAVNDFLATMLVSADPEQARGEGLTVREVVDAASAGIDGAFPDRPLVEASVRSTLGATYRSLGLYDRAETHLSIAARLASAHAGPDDPASIAIRRSLGTLAVDRGRFEDAEALFAAVQASLDRTGGDPAERLRTGGEIARLRTEQGNLEDASAMLARLADEAATVLGPDDPARLTMVHNHASTLRLLGDLHAAEELSREVLDARERTLGPDHPHTLYSANALAAVLQRRGDLESAEAMYLRTLDARIRVLGADHPGVNTVRMNLANLYLTTGRLEAAAPLVAAALESCRRTFGPTHPRTLMAVNMHGYLLEDLGRLDEAEAAYRDAIRLFGAAYGPSNPEWYPPGNNLASLLQTRGDLEAAVARFQDLVEQARRHLPETQLYRLVIENNAGDCLRAAGRLADARPLLEESLARLESGLGPDHPRTLKARARLTALEEAERSAVPSAAPLEE